MVSSLRQRAPGVPLCARVCLCTRAIEHLNGGRNIPAYKLAILASQAITFSFSPNSARNFSASAFVGDAPPSTYERPCRLLLNSDSDMVDSIMVTLEPLCWTVAAAVSTGAREGGWGDWFHLACSFFFGANGWKPIWPSLGPAITSKRKWKGRKKANCRTTTQGHTRLGKGSTAVATAEPQANLLSVFSRRPSTFAPTFVLLYIFFCPLFILRQRRTDDQYTMLLRRPGPNGSRGWQNCASVDTACRAPGT